jgi:hypothetical protein
VIWSKEIIQQKINCNSVIKICTGGMYIIYMYHRILTVKWELQNGEQIWDINTARKVTQRETLEKIFRLGSQKEWPTLGRS